MTWITIVNKEMMATNPFRFALFSPAGNTTALVLERVAAPVKDRLVAALFADLELKIEQVGFIVPGTEPAPHLPRMEMMGGEFCGNATRAAAAWFAMKQAAAKRNSTDLTITVSGSAAPMACQIIFNAQGVATEATCQIPLPERIIERDCVLGGEKIPVAQVDFPGISHLILQDVPASEEVLTELIDQLQLKAAAVGVMFTRQNYQAMTPLVYVAATATTVFEGGCGSGTAAVGAYLATKSKGSILQHIKQPGGSISVAASYRQGNIAELTIGGSVDYRGVSTITLPEAR